MPMSLTVEQNLKDLLARAEEISTPKDAQQFADDVSGVCPSLTTTSITSDPIVLHSRSWTLMKCSTLN